MFTFNKNNTFSGKVDGKSVSGTWTYDANNQKITLKTLLFTIPVYNLQAIGELSKNYDGVRMGFDMKK